MTTGKNKEKFKKWYHNECLNDEIDYYSFRLLPFEMQIGVYEAYYDSLEIYINAMSYERGSYWIGNVDVDITRKKNTRPEAYQEAFKKANELRNEKLK